MKRQPRVSVKEQQTGAMLYTTLFILLILTVLAASAITLTSSEQQMATNAHASRLAFHASESAINAAIKDDSKLLEATTSGTSVLNVNLANPQLTSTATINLTGSGTATGFSLGIGSGTFGTYQFEITGTGEITSLPSKVEAVQGLYKIAPSG